MRSTSRRSPRSVTRHSPGRAYYERKIAEGKTTKEAIRVLKRRISDAIYDRLVDDAARTRAREGNRGRLNKPAWPASHPERRLFGKATPEPATSVRRGTHPLPRHAADAHQNVDERGLDNKEEFVPALVPVPRTGTAQVHRDASYCHVGVRTRTRTGKMRPRGGAPRDNHPS